MILSGKNFRSISDQTGNYSYVFGVKTKTKSSDIYVGLTGDYNIDYRFISGKIFDRNRDFVSSYSKNGNYIISGNLKNNHHEYFINGVPKIVGETVPSGKISGVFAINEEPENIDFKFYGETPSYSITTSSNQLISGQTLTGFINNNNPSLSFTVFTGELLNSDIPATFSIDSNQDVTGSAEFYLTPSQSQNLSGVANLLFYTNFGEIEYSYNLTGGNLPSVIKSSYYLTLQPFNPNFEGSSGSLSITSYYANFDGANVKVSLSHVSGQTGEIFRDKSFSRGFSHTQDDSVTGTNIVSIFKTGLVSGYNASGLIQTGMGSGILTGYAEPTGQIVNDYELVLTGLASGFLDTDINLAGYATSRFFGFVPFGSSSILTTANDIAGTGILNQEQLTGIIRTGIGEALFNPYEYLPTGEINLQSGAYNTRTIEKYISYTGAITGYYDLAASGYAGYIIETGIFDQNFSGNVKRGVYTFDKQYDTNITGFDALFGADTIGEIVSGGLPEVTGESFSLTGNLKLSASGECLEEVPVYDVSGYSVKYPYNFNIANLLLSLSKLNPSFTGSIMTVERASDGETKDIYFYNKYINYENIKQFAQSGEVYINEWKDQSLNKNNYIPSTVDRPKILIGPGFFNSGIYFYQNWLETSNSLEFIDGEDYSIIFSGDSPCDFLAGSYYNSSIDTGALNEGWNLDVWNETVRYTGYNEVSIPTVTGDGNLYISAIDENQNIYINNLISEIFIYPFDATAIYSPTGVVSGVGPPVYSIFADVSGYYNIDTDIHPLGQKTSSQKAANLGNWAVFPPSYDEYITSYNPYTQVTQFQSEPITGVSYGAAGVGNWVAMGMNAPISLVFYDPETDIVKKFAYSKAVHSTTAVGNLAVFGVNDSSNSKVAAYCFDPVTEQGFELNYTGNIVSEDSILFRQSATVGDWAVFCPNNSEQIIAVNPSSTTTNQVQHMQPRITGDAGQLAPFMFSGPAVVGDWAVMAGRTGSVVSYNPTANDLYIHPQEIPAIPMSFAERNGSYYPRFGTPTVVGDWAVFPPLRGTGILAYNPITRIQKSLYFNGEDFEISNPEEATNFSSAATLGKWAIFAPQSASASLAYDPVENVYHKFYNELTEGYTMSTTVNDEWVVQYPNTADSFASIKIANPFSNPFDFLCPQEVILFTVDTSINTSLEVELDPLLSYSAVIDWGDGSTNTLLDGIVPASISHTYATVNTFEVSVSGTSVPKFELSSELNVVSAILENLLQTTENMFFACRNLQSATIGDGITSIGDRAFQNCVSLRSIIIGNSVTSIGIEAFLFCWLLNAITLPDSLKSIGSSAFRICERVQSITVPDSVTSIGDRAFSQMERLTSVTLPNNVDFTRIEEYTFADTSLTSITIPDSVTYIGNGAFADTSLTSITIPASVTSKGSLIFNDCDLLTNIVVDSANPNFSSTGPLLLNKSGSIVLEGFGVSGDFTIPSTINVIAFAAFTGTGLTSITIPDSVENMGAATFANCENLTSATIGNGVVLLGEGTFRRCYNLSVVNLSIPKSVIDGASSMDGVPDTFEYTASPLTINVPIGTPGWVAGTGLTIGGNTNVTVNIGEPALEPLLFTVDTSISTSLIIDLDPSLSYSAVIDWGDGSTDTLLDGIVPASISHTYATVNTFEVSVSGTSVPKFELSSELNVVSAILENLPQTTEDIFNSCTGLTSVTIGNRLTSIGSGAFYGCTGLTSVTIPESVETIGNSAFQSCSLTSITIPDSVTSIGGAAFAECTDLATVTLPNNINFTSIEDFAFGGCTGLTSITIPNSVETIGYQAFENCYILTSVTIGNNVESIGIEAFMSTGLTSVTIPISVTSIGINAFRNCSDLATVDLSVPKTVIDSATNVFFNTASLLTINVPYGTSGWVAGTGLTIGGNTNVTVNIITPEAMLFTVDASINTSFLVRRDSRDIYSGAIVWGDGSADEALSGSGIVIIEHTFPSTEVYQGMIIGTSVPSISFDYNRSLTSFENLGDVGLNSTEGMFTNCIGLTSVTISDSLTRIDNGTFRDCISLTSITIPDSVTYIGNGAFWGTGLTSITISDNVTTIGGAAFRECADLASVIIGNGVEVISGNVFAECTDLATVTIGNSVTSIEQYAFQGCTGLTTITIPDSVEIIDTSAFRNCSGLTTITIGNSVTSIRSGAFDNSGLTSVTIPNSVTSILNEAFQSCTDLVSVTLPNNVNFTSIEQRAFKNCGLTNVIIPENVTRLESGAFQGCTSLASVIIGNGVEFISNDVFQGCTGLTSVTIGNNVESIGITAFEDCSDLASITIPDSVTSIRSGAFRNCTSLTSITIPDSVTNFENYAFEDCSDLATVNFSIPKTVIDSAPYIFSGTAPLLTINVPYGTAGWTAGTGLTIGGNTNVTVNIILPEAMLFTVDASINTSFQVELDPLLSYSAVIDWGDGSTNTLLDGIVPASISHTYATVNTFEVIVTGTSIPKFELSSELNLTSFENLGDVGLNSTANMFSNCTGLTSVTISDSLTIIDGGTFSGCTGLTSIIIPDSVETIGLNAFRGTDLASATLPNNVGFTRVENYLFYQCTSLSSVTIPNSVTSIGSAVFNECISLTSITIPDSVETIGGVAFKNCGLTSITIPDNVTTIGGAAFAYCTDLATVIIGNGVEVISTGVFEECTGLSSVTIGNSVTSIGSQAFYFCSSLSSITIPDSVEIIDTSAFRNCSSLTSITIANSVSSIGNYAFADTSLTSITIPDSVETIGTRAFNSCFNLTSITLPTNVNFTSIENNTFQSCVHLASITIPNSVETIGNLAFQFCDLTSITIPNSVTSIGYSAFQFCNGLASVNLSVPKTVIDSATNIFSSTASPLTINVPVGTSGWVAGTGQTIGGNTNVTVNIV